MDGCFLFFFFSFGVHPDLHSFPTRRSSDLFLRPAIGHNDVSSLVQERQSHRLAQRTRAAGNQYKFSTEPDRKSTRLNSSHTVISYAVFCLKKKSTRYRAG